jgi:hypothetical protein
MPTEPKLASAGEIIDAYQVDEIKRLTHEIDKLKEDVLLLLKLVGAPAYCKGCAAPIFWVRHLGGKSAPYDPDGINHFRTCPKANDFRRKHASTGTDDRNPAE